MIPTKFPSIWPSGFREEDLLKSTNKKKKNCVWRPRLLTDRNEMCNHYRGHSIDASYQDLIKLAKRFQRRRLKNIHQSKSRFSFGGYAY
jgi:hypothetical protein